DVSVDEVNEAFSDAANGALGSVMHYSSEPLVSSDIIGSPASCTIDAQLTMASANLVKVCGWYDNEWGYSNRLAELAQRVGAELACRVRQ
ncbi:MAG: type I glyceraldehyde-3-phosphate dehydrogenase, partial [Actinomycetota bacterium]